MRPQLHFKPRPCRRAGDEPRQLAYERDALKLRLLRTVGVEIPGNLVIALHEDEVRAVQRPEYGDYLTVTFLLGGSALRRKKLRHAPHEFCPPGQVSLQPHDVASVWDSAGPSRWLQFYLPASLLTQVAEEGLGLGQDSLRILPTTGVSDFELRRVLFAAARATLAPGNPSFEEIEHWSLAIAESLLRHHSTAAGQLGSAGRECLSTAQLSRVTDYIEAHLDQKISLEALGRELGMSPFHFAHGFKWRTGLSPYKYVQRRRVERGRLLLDEGERSVCDIAHALGYSSHAHFSTAFRQELGVSPRLYRQLTAGALAPVA